METTIITEVTENMEVIPTYHSTPELAKKDGDRVASNRSRRGYPTQCIGVVKDQSETYQRGYRLDGEGYSHETLETATIRGYKPVLVEG